LFYFCLPVILFCHVYYVLGYRVRHVLQNIPFFLVTNAVNEKKGGVVFSVVADFGVGLTGAWCIGRFTIFLG